MTLALQRDCLENLSNSYLRKGKKCLNGTGVHIVAAISRKYFGKKLTGGMY